MSKKFTEAQIVHIAGTYTAAIEQGMDYETRNDLMEKLASDYEVTINVIRAKLVAEGVYKKKEASEKTATVGGKNKAELVSAFEAIMGVKLVSMSNMTKKDLEVMWDRFISMSEARNVAEGKLS